MLCTAHSQSGARKDMVNMRLAAAPGAVAVADDINSHPGHTLQTLAEQGTLDLLESYGPFEAPSPHNPCMRTAARGPYCASWGFAVYVYTTSNKSNPGFNVMRSRKIVRTLARTGSGKGGKVGSHPNRKQLTRP